MDPRRLAMAAAACVALIGFAVSAAGCKSSKSEPTATPAPFVSPTPEPPTADALTAVAAPDAVELTPYADPGGRYTVEVPKAWSLEQKNPNAVQITLPGGPATPVQALLFLDCEAGLTADAYIQQDIALGNKLHTGVFDATAFESGTVAGQPAKIFTWGGGAAGLPLQHIEVYFEGKGCAWRVHLSVFPGLQAMDLRPLLNRILDSFKFT